MHYLLELIRYQTWPQKDKWPIEVWKISWCEKKLPPLEPTVTLPTWIKYALFQLYLEPFWQNAFHMHFITGWPKSEFLISNGSKYSWTDAYLTHVGKVKIGSRGVVFSHISWFSHTFQMKIWKMAIFFILLHGLVLKAINKSQVHQKILNFWKNYTFQKTIFYHKYYCLSNQFWLYQHGWSIGSAVEPFEIKDFDLGHPVLGLNN